MSADELSFRRGDVITVTAKGTASGFWEGYVAIPAPTITKGDGQATFTVKQAEDTRGTAASSSSHSPGKNGVGAFPNCFVTSNLRLRLTQSYGFQNRAMCLYAYTAMNETEMSLSPGEIVTATRPSASPGWWYGVKEEKSNAATATLGTSSGNGAGPHPSSSELLFPTNFVVCDIVQAIFRFDGKLSHEVSCRPGDVIRLHRRWNDGWWEGTLSGQRGIFPSNYTVPNICTTTPPLFCPRCRTVFATSLFETDCAVCAAERGVEESMMRALQAYVDGKMEKLDLFAYVDVDPCTCTTVARKPPHAEQAERRHQRGRIAEREASGVSTTCGGDAPDSGQRLSSDQDCSSAEPRATVASGRVPRRRALLTEKDVADLTSGRVKFTE